MLRAPFGEETAGRERFALAVRRAAAAFPVTVRRPGRFANALLLIGPSWGRDPPGRVDRDCAA